MRKHWGTKSGKQLGVVGLSGRQPGENRESTFGTKSETIKHLQDKHETTERKLGNNWATNERHGDTWKTNSKKQMGIKEGLEGNLKTILRPKDN